MGMISKALEILGYSERTGFDYLADGAAVTSLASPWTPDPTMLSAVIPPMTGESIVTETTALSVPPVARAVALLSTLTADLQIVSRDSGQVPHWMNHTTEPTPSGNRWVRVVQDLIFYGGSCLLRVTDPDGTLTGTLHIPKQFWSFTPTGDLQLLGQPTSDAVRDSLIYIPSLLPTGFLTYGATAVRQYLSICQTIDSRASNPVPLVNLQVVDPMEVTEAELVQAQNNWAAARRSKNGAVSITPAGVKVETPGQGGADDAQMLIGARNAVRLDVANYLNINAAMLDGNNGTSDTYSNTLQNQNELVRLSLATWLTPITNRLSQPDVSPVRVRFDTDPVDAMPDAAGNIGTATTPSERIAP